MTREVLKGVMVKSGVDCTILLVDAKRLMTMTAFA